MTGLFLKQKIVMGLVLAMTVGVVQAADSAQSAAPVAAKKSHMVPSPNGEREDDYYWLRDDSRKDPEMLAYLNSENAYADSMLAGVKGLRDKIYQELVSHIQQDDSTVPYRLRGYWYYTRFETGKDYPILARRKGSQTAPEEVMLDQNAMAEGKGFYSAQSPVVSQNNQLLAYAEDVVGRRQYVLKIKDLKTGKILEDAVPNIEPDLIWADDNKTIFYIDKDPVTLLSKRVKSHVIGMPASADQLVYEEPDDSFYIGLERSRSDRFLCISVRSTVSSEQRCASAKDPKKFAVIAPRQRDFHYSADHLNGRWVIRTDWDAKNYRLMSMKDSEPLGDRSLWRDLVPHSSNVFIARVELFNKFMVIEQREGGVKKLRLVAEDGKSRDVAADEPAYSMSIDVNAEPDRPRLRYSYTSLTTPKTIYEVDAENGRRKLLKQQPVPGGFDQKNYVTERVWVPARDGTKIPVSLLYRKGFSKDGKGAMLQYGYGSYGLSTDAQFSPNILSLVDRGMVYAIAHVRGGQEMGRAWYDDGKLLKKKNSFTDFIDVTQGLTALKYAAPDRVAALGGSAGGLLMGAVANMAPESYRVIIAQVPFVDVVTTMLDESIPLTTNEFDEWGNPKEKQYYDYMLSYSPYDNVGHKSYPALFVGTGLWDSQVQYFEPAKWVAKLRTMKTDSNPLVFRVNMEAGHGGKSGRFQRLNEVSEYYAFALRQLGVE